MAKRIDEDRLKAIISREIADAKLIYRTDAEKDPKPPWRDRKEAYITSLAHKPADSLLVSLADKTHNARAILDDEKAGGTDETRESVHILPAASPATASGPRTPTP